MGFKLFPLYEAIYLAGSYSEAPADPITRYFIEFNAAATQHIELSDTLNLVGDFELDIDYAKSSEDLGALVGSGEGDFIRLSATGAIQYMINSNYYSTGVTAPNDGVLTNLRFTRTGSIGKLFVNDVEVDSRTITTDDFTINYLASRGTGTFFSGILAGIKVWSGGDRDTGSLVIDMPLDDDLDSTIVVNNSTTLGSELALNVEDFVVNDSTQKTIATGITNGQTYLISIPAGLRISGPSGWSASNSDGEEFLATANINGNFSVLNISGSPITLTDVSVKEVPSETPYGSTVNMTSADSSLYTEYPDQLLWGTAEYPNLLPNSSDLLSNKWSSAATSVTDTGSGAFTVQHTTTAGRVFTAGNIDLNSEGKEFTFSIEVKEGTSSGFFRMLAVDNVAAPGAYIHLWVNTSNVALGTSASNGNAVLNNATVTDIGDGWMRVTLSGRINLTSEVGFWGYITASDGSTARSTSISQLWRKPMLNLGLSVLDYKQTTGTAGEFLEYTE